MLQHIIGYIIFFIICFYPVLMLTYVGIGIFLSIKDWYEKRKV